MSLSIVESLKSKGNSHYITGNKYFPDEQSISHYKQACIFYGLAIEQINLLESGEIDVSDAVQVLKPTLFLNLALANLKLSNYEGCRRCCNSCLLFCNNPSLSLSSMGIDDDITIDIQPVYPIIPSLSKLVVKALFRRGKSLIGLKNNITAKADLELAHSLMPGDAEIMNSFDEVCRVQANSMTLLSNDSLRSTEVDDHVADSTTYDTSSMTRNGGPCLYRQGLWSQSTTDTMVYIPLTIASGATELSQASHWKVVLTSRDIQVIYKDTPVIMEELHYNINSEECTWLLEDYSITKAKVSRQQHTTHLVIYLRKVPPAEWFPGCEWWDRVFKYDEPIDTMTCSVGSNIQELPREAVDRSYREHNRFISLSSEQQAQELDELRVWKTTFNKSVEKTRSEAEAEESAIAELPERSQIYDLRKQFPSINFTLR